MVEIELADGTVASVKTIITEEKLAAPSSRLRERDARRRLPTRLTRRARARTRFGWARSERATVGLAAVALGGAGAVLAGQFGRMLRRRAHETADGEGLVEAAPAAALDTVGVAVGGYSDAPRSETVLFNLLAGFLGSFALVGSRPGGSATAGGRFATSGSAAATSTTSCPASCSRFASATAALLTDDEELEERLAVPMGVGMGLTFDEAALLLDLRDVYWTREGLLSVQLSLGATAILSIAILTRRMLRRGERRQEAEGLIPVGPRRHKKGRPEGRPFFPYFVLSRKASASPSGCRSGRSHRRAWCHRRRPRSACALRWPSGHLAKRYGVFL